MIDKLPFTEIHTGGEDLVDRVEFRPVAPYEMQHKINQLVDAVNELTSCVGQLGVEFTDPIPAENALIKSLRMDKEFAEDECVRLQAELERTRKALDVAVDALNTIKGKHDPRCAVYHIDEKTAYDALEQITAALENQNGNR